jgi:hypothetical protein
MGQTHERPWQGTAAGCLAWSLAVIACAYPIYVSVADENQGLVIRLAAALIVGIVLLQIHNRVRSDLDGQQPSRFDLARETVPRSINIDPHLKELCGDLQNSVKSRRYFERILWPRLVALAERHGSTLRLPPLRWPAARGPSLGAIAELISSVERKP